MYERFAALQATLRSDVATTDLATSLEGVLSRLESHWSHTHLPWFTDHGVNHGRRVVEYALEMADVPSLNAQLRLRPLELYVLAAAALLHDVGMNDLALCARPLDQLDHDDFERIRHDHPRRSAQLIMQSPSDWGLPPHDSVLAEVVALVAQAHGTRYYRDTLTLLRERMTVRNESIRTPLLAALLLMADELDLHYERDVPLPGNPTLTHISQAHGFKHRSVVSCGVCASPDGTLNVRIALSVSPALGTRNRDDLERWIVAKLRWQMGLTSRELHEGFAGQVRFGRAIAVQEQIALAPRPLPPQAALALIRAEVEAQRVLDHGEAISKSRDALATSDVLVVLGDYDSKSGDDLDGREDVLRVLIASLRTEASVYPLVSRRLVIANGGEASDVLEEWLLEAGEEATSDSRSVPEDERRNALRQRLALLLEGLPSGAHVVLAASGIDLLAYEAAQWLLSAATSFAMPSGIDCAVVVTSGTLIDVAGLPVTLTSIPTSPMDRTELQAYFGQYQDSPHAAATSSADINYSAFKRIALSYETRLAGGAT